MMSLSVDPLSTKSQISLAALLVAAGSSWGGPALLWWERKAGWAASDWGSAYAGGAIATMAATLVNISRRFILPESSKVASKGAAPGQNSTSVQTANPW